MTRVAIVSDNHSSAPRGLADVLEGADVILHAGDIETQSSWDEISSLAPVAYAVLGNCDDPADFDEGIPYEEVIEIDGVEFAIGHEPEAAVRARSAASGAGAIVTIHGHTHIPTMSRLADDDLRLCPGCLAHPHDDNPRSIAIVDVEDGKIEDAVIVSLSGKVIMR